MSGKVAVRSPLLTGAVPTHPTSVSQPFSASRVAHYTARLSDAVLSVQDKRHEERHDCTFQNGSEFHRFLVLKQKKYHRNTHKSQPVVLIPVCVSVYFFSGNIFFRGAPGHRQEFEAQWPVVRAAVTGARRVGDARSFGRTARSL